MDAVPAIRERQIIFLGSKGGGDPYAREFDELLTSRPWCRFDGLADREKLRTYFSQARLLVLASLEDNCPMVVLEAMAAGVPVIAGAVGGVPELIDDGVTGVLCDPTSKESMQSAVTNFFASENSATAMAKRAKETALVRFHPRVIAERHLAIYREVLSNRS